MTKEQKQNIKYRTGGYRYKGTIEKVIVERETEPSVYLNGRRYLKRSEKHNFFDSFKKAKTFLLEKAEFDVNRYKKHLTNAQEKLEAIKSLTEEDLK